MGRYEPLAAFLKRRREERWSASFADIEGVLGFALPDSARRYSAWWANQQGGGHSQASWQEVGWKTCNLNLARERVDFERQPARDAPVSSGAVREASHAYGSASELSPRERIEAAIRLAQDLTGIRDRDEIIAAAMQRFVEHAAAQRLAALGGTVPDFAAPARRRPDAS